MRRLRNSSDSDVTTFDPRAPREFWLDGESVMCACPDCGAPISIRLWLMVADCWQCGCSIEITEEQERRIHSLLQRKQSEVGDSKLLSESDGTQTRAHTHAPVPPPKHTPASPQTAPNHAREHNQTLQAVPNSRRVPDKTFQPSPPRSLRDWFDQMPAWLISMLFHMAILALLALLFFEGNGLEDPYITLSTEASRFGRSGGEIKFDTPRDPFHYDLPIPDKDAPKTPQQRRAMAKANQDAKELRVDPKASMPQLPTLAQVKRKLQSADSTQRTLAARDPRVRAEIVTREGGTTLTEAAVARGLRWLAQHQNANGSWSLQTSKCPSCRGRCDGDGHIRTDTGATSLALLPFLGAGQTHQVGIYKDTVAQGLRWLLSIQKEDGDLRGNSSGNAGMYAHGQAAIVLCEAFALTGDEQLREAAQKSIDFICIAQHAEGGWRYSPGQQGDTSVLGWQLMALQSARAAQLEVQPDVLELAGIFLDSVQYDDGSRYAYLPGRGPTYTMTAEALLCRMYLGWTNEFAGLSQGVKYLLKEHRPRSRGKANYYYWYYATQVFHHVGGRYWEKWNLAMRDRLVGTQTKRGHEAGSWDPDGPHGHQGGRLYCTALAVCTLEVYYRHAPIFRQLELEQEN